MANIHDLLSKLWHDYAALNPQARKIHKLLEARGENVVNDHIALRTFDDPRVNVDTLARPFTELGYVAKDTYDFPEKKLNARHYEHADDGMPKVFISELRLGGFSASLRSVVSDLLGQMPADLSKRWDFPVAGRPWVVSYAEYESLRSQSEYAAWMAAFGFRANHFTVLVNALKKFDSLQALNAFLKEHGFKLNASGGEIKGSPDVFLEQSATLADEADVDFTDGVHRIPACYYEFARRYPLPDGTLFQGFVAKSADKIFESTNKR